MGADLQRPADVANLLNQRLTPHFQKHRMEFRCHLVSQVRNLELMIPMGFNLSGAYKKTCAIEAPRFFMFTVRGWLSLEYQNNIEQPPPFSASNSPNDVVLILKQSMTDNHLSQRPLLVMPAEMRNLSVAFVHSWNNSPIWLPQTLSDETKVGLSDLARVLERNYSHRYSRATEYLDWLVSGVRDATDLPLRMFDNPRSHIRGRHGTDVDIQPIADAFVPRQMRVKFDIRGAS